MNDQKTKRIPKYKQIQEDLRQKISDGVYQPGNRLPPDSELYQYYSVNRLTVIRALEELCREGLIVRQHGSGTYVADFNETPFIAGKDLKIGIIFDSTIDSKFINTRSNGEDILSGILNEWNIVDKKLVPVSKNKAMDSRAIIDLTNRGLKIICMGQPADGYFRHPVLKAVQEENFDGIILCCISDDPWISQVLDLNIPTVIIDHPADTFGQRADHVFVDPLSGYSSAVRYYIKKGKTVIHFLGQNIWKGAPDEHMSVDEWKRYPHKREIINPDSKLRLNTVRQEMLENGLVIRKDQVHFTFFRDSKLRILAKQLIALPPETRPQVIISHSISQASLMIQEFRKQGLSLEGTGMSGIGDHGPSIQTRVKDLGIIGADLLYSRLKKPDRLFYNIGVQTWFNPGNNQ